MKSSYKSKSPDCSSLQIYLQILKADTLISFKVITNNPVKCYIAKIYYDFHSKFMQSYFLYEDMKKFFSSITRLVHNPNNEYLQCLNQSLTLIL